MTNQLNNLIKHLPALLKENELGVLTETNIDFTLFSKNERSKSEIHWLIHPEESGGLSAAIVRYYPGGESPLHLHTGFELAYVLDGDMITNQGPVKKNDLIVLPPGSKHNCRSENGFLALMIWEKTPEGIDE
ncbi:MULTISPECIES: cupin domain-containing protein [Bacillus cereus group]|uniref:cupin domain-containing protein n=1 Tax=Bacillus cereus group TaxID=86661 RepID=UPI000BFA1C6A|nr:MULTISPECIES: cupin domain-containing protein [Bacillus cereus group]MBY0018460.1 cupin domain-containing protein [Bacillus cereus]PEY81753.1 hypothetical protein CN351_26810 [Bacillus thuringiensis]PFD38592.1 hypothetical protein CN278_06080 [Bacillus thuringiensis]PFE60500.1 hypothetical protein CN322_25285 [Bacillus thuringiensis]PFI31132.1 hypothetical protein COI77_26055 [Bacillus thuringiensis]